jgi:ABC-type transport system involved in cytochrome c biogenesis permease subunit
MRRAFPWIVLVAAVAWTWQSGRAPALPADGMDLEAFGRIPVVHGGRSKPMDSLARAMLRVISERETFVDADGKTQPAMRWLLDVFADPFDEKARGRKHKVFRIVNLQVQDGLQLQPREGFRYAIEEFGVRVESILEAAEQVDARRQGGKELDPYERKLLEFVHQLQTFQSLSSWRVPHLVPGPTVRDWKTVATAMGDARREGRSDATSEAFVAALRAYAAGDAAKFNESVAGLVARDREAVPSETAKAATELDYNRRDLFNLCKIFYLLGLVMTCLGWLGWTGPLNRSVLRLGWYVFALHTAALVLRIYLSGRPPVTNLYSSAIFIGWGTALFGLVLEALTRQGVGNLIAMVSGYGTLQVAHVLAADGDTMEVLQAVLDTQFWLATHVTCITKGYATTYVAGLIGVVYVLRGLLTPTLSEEIRNSMARMMYGVICFATFFSFVGTVLGGLWADDSWGRFWGWDPKENGALMIVLWNVLILHARWGGLVRERGLAVLCVFGNVVVSWSWFGVNNLGKGLHAYGFTEGRAFWLLLFVLSQMLVVGAGMLPRKFWRSPEAVREPKAVGS